MSAKSHHTLNSALAAFWTIWLAIVLASDACDLFIYQGWLATDWPFTSGNLGVVFKMVSHYGLSSSITITLFLLIILWCFCNLILFLVAFSRFKERKKFLQLAGWSYVFLIGLHLCFAITDELFIFYDFTDGLMARVSFIILCYGGLLFEIRETKE